jgi:FkbM family methyltransferase
MKKILIKIFHRLILLLGQHRAKHLLWGALARTMKESYQPGGQGEDYFLTALSNQNSNLCIIDVGANVGMWSKKVAQKLLGSEIYAIEAIPEFFDKIDTSNIHQKYNIALSDKEETLQIFQSGGGAKPVAKKNTKAKKTVIHEVKALTGDQFVDENNIKKVDFIKIDTDGFDFQILSGFREVINRDQPLVQFELSHWWLSLGYTIKLAEKFFSEKQYSLFVMKDDGLYKLEYQIPDHLFITANILAIHESRLPLIETAQQSK